MSPVRSVKYYAKRAADNLAEFYADAPHLEFLAWIQIALRRESMVVEAYSNRYLNGHLEKLASIHADRSIITIISDAISSAWAQEAGHKAYFEAILRSVAAPEILVDRIKANIQSIFGQLEGEIIASAGSPNIWQRLKAMIILRMAQLVTDIPDFVTHLSELNFVEFAILNRDLENTAVIGYRRMLKLLNGLQTSHKFPAGTTLVYDLSSTLRDEIYHEALFNELARLFDSSSDIGSISSERLLDSIRKAQNEAYSAELQFRAADGSSIRGLMVDQRAKKVINVEPDSVNNDPMIVSLRSLYTASC